MTTAIVKKTLAPTSTPNEHNLQPGVTPFGQTPLSVGRAPGTPTAGNLRLTSAAQFFPMLVVSPPRPRPTVGIERSHVPTISEGSTETAAKAVDAALLFSENSPTPTNQVVMAVCTALTEIYNDIYHSPLNYYHGTNLREWTSQVGAMIVKILPMVDALIRNSAINVRIRAIVARQAIDVGLLAQGHPDIARVNDFDQMRCDAIRWANIVTDGDGSIATNARNVVKIAENMFLQVGASHISRTAATVVANVAVRLIEDASDTPVCTAADAVAQCAAALDAIKQDPCQRAFSCVEIGTEEYWTQTAEDAQIEAKYLEKKNHAIDALKSSIGKMEFGVVGP